MTGPTAPPSNATEPADKATPDTDNDDDDGPVTITVGGKTVVVDPARVQALVASLRSAPDVDGASALFSFMADMPGAELGPARPLEPIGPGTPDPSPQDDAPHRPADAAEA